jgi:carbon-monoxide dehydrogenase medium subunit
MPAVAVALGARFRLASSRGERWVEAEDFFNGLFTTALEADELLLEVEIPPPPAQSGGAFLEIARRHGDYALAGVALTVATDDNGACTGACLVAMGVGDRPTRSTSIEGVLVGRQPEEALFETAAAAVRAEIEPVGDIHASTDFKRHLTGVLTRRALVRAFDRATGGSPGR